MSATIVLGSTGGAAEYRGAFLGEFVGEGKYNGRPSFRQRNTEGGQEKFLLFDQNSWWVSSVLRNRQNTELPPATGWEFFNNNKEWKNDDITLALEFSSLSPCQVIQVEADEEVRKYTGQILGKYMLLEERWSSGKPVYQKTNSEQEWYLLVPNRTTLWVIRSSITDKRARKWLASGRATNLPTNAEAGPRPSDGVRQWRYWDGNGYKEGDINITCTCWSKTTLCNICSRDLPIELLRHFLFLSQNGHIKTSHPYKTWTNLQYFAFRWNLNDLFNVQPLKYEWHTCRQQSSTFPIQSNMHKGTSN